MDIGLNAISSQYGFFMTPLEINAGYHYTGYLRNKMFTTDLGSKPNIASHI